MFGFAKAVYKNLKTFGNFALKKYLFKNFILKEISVFDYSQEKHSPVLL